MDQPPVVFTPESSNQPRFLKVIFGLLIFLILLLVGFNFALNRYGAFWRSSEVPIGKDFIALPEQKILEFLNLPENKDKIICPVNIDGETELKTTPIENGGDTIALTNFKEKNPTERVLLNPSTLGGAINSVQRDYGRDVNFTLESGLKIKIVNPEKVLVIAETPDGKVKAKFGDVLATGFRNHPPGGQITEELALVIYINDPNNPRGFLRASEFMLKYKGRWVALAEK